MPQGDDSRFETQRTCRVNPCAGARRAPYAQRRVALAFASAFDQQLRNRPSFLDMTKGGFLHRPLLLSSAQLGVLGGQSSNVPNRENKPQKAPRGAEVQKNLRGGSKRVWNYGHFFAKNDPRCCGLKDWPVTFPLRPGTSGSCSARQAW